MQVQLCTRRDDPHHKSILLLQYLDLEVFPRQITVYLSDAGSFNTFNSWGYRHCHLLKESTPRMSDEKIAV